MENRMSKKWSGVLAALLVAGVPVAGSCAEANAGGQAVIARVNGAPLTKAQLDLAMRLSGLPDNDAARAALKKDLIAGEVVRQAADKAQYGKRAEVVEAAKSATARAESELYLRDNVHPAAVTDAQVKARYDAIVASLGEKEFKTRIISVKDDATASAVLGKLKSGAGFENLARQYSEASNKNAGGDLGWVSFKTPVQEGKTAGLPLDLARAIADLPAGGTTKAPVIIDGSRIIVRVEEARPTQVPAYEQAKGPIRQQLEAVERKQATDALVSKLVGQAKVQ